ncbi:MAG: DUF126 domain-containing protein [Rhodospirillales bacterium]|nr:DUF126 domain-containing protein [Rhodospirillales bacterium]
MNSVLIQGHPGIGPKATGLALVADDNFSARYDLNRIEGVFSRPAHKLFGQAYVGKILVLNIAKGGVATAWMLHEMASRGMAPAALLLNYANPIIAQGAAFGGIALVDRFDVNITARIITGDTVSVDPATGEVIVSVAQPA